MGKKRKPDLSTKALKDSQARSRPMEQQLEGFRGRFEAGVEDTRGLQQRLGAATSSALASRPIGCLATTASRIASASLALRNRVRIISVSIEPGQTQLTRMLSAAWSSATAMVSAITPPLEAE